MSIILKNALLSKYDINEILPNNYHIIDFDYDICVYILIKDFLDDFFIYNLSLVYEENNINNYINHNKITIKKDSFVNSFTSNLDFLINQFEQQKKCNHVFEHDKDLFNNDFPDGRAFCILCSKKHPSFFSPNINHQIVKGIGVEYVTQFNWGNTYLQCGKSGIVFSDKKTYKTAFFESFPKIGNFDTFIRGEGEDLKQAESNCWEKYQKQLNCKEHEFTRIVKGKYREDGSGTCIHCNLYSSKALDPLTKCCICNNSTNDTIYQSKIYCYQDFFKINNLDYVNSLKENDNNFDKSDFLFFYFEFYINNFIFNQYGYDFFVNNKDRIFQIYCYLIDHILKVNFNIKPFDEITDDYPDYNDPVFIKNIVFFLNNIKEILTFKTFDDINKFLKTNI